MNLPYIEPTRHSPPNHVSGGSLEDAIGYADRSYDAYEGKITEELRRQQGLSTALIGVSALAIGAGLADAHRDVFRVLGLGSATAYQLGSWNSNPKRLSIYVDGMKALVCAKAAVQPLRMSKEARGLVRNARGQLNAAVKVAAEAMKLAGPARVAPGEGSGPQALQAELLGLQGDLEEARKQQQRAASVEQRADSAGAMLQQKVDDIRTILDEALLATQADPANLRAAIQGLAAYATQFNTDAMAGSLAIAELVVGPGKSSIPGLGTKQSLARTSDAASQPDASLGAALGAVSGARIEVQGAVAEVKGTIDRQFEGVAAGLGGCGIDISKFATGLALEESTLKIKAGQTAPAEILIKSGTRPFRVDVSTVPGLTVKLSAEGGAVLVSAETKTEAGSYGFKVRDAASQSATLTVTVTVEAAKAGVDAAPLSGDKESRSLARPNLCNGLEQLGHARTCYLQQQLEIDVDGQVGPQTCKAFSRALSGKVSSAEDGFAIVARAGNLRVGSPDEDYMNSLGASELQSCRAGLKKKAARDDGQADIAVNGKDADLSAAQVRELAGLLGQEPVTDLNQLRAALGDNQRASKCPDTKGVFTAAEVKRLQDKRKCG
ncbi:hypothetical protein ACG04Q_20355 [Roseateles sp. DXS20W]|uniref:Peptidoglycan binding-like domain-containing protein n=1 Tax=Pelomonas lactea TaxID=3299030 RepID=A0ABW7GPP3_9BURK